MLQQTPLMSAQITFYRLIRKFMKSPLLCSQASTKTYFSSNCVISSRLMRPFWLQKRSIMKEIWRMNDCNVGKKSKPLLISNVPKCIVYLILLVQIQFHTSVTTFCFFFCIAVSFLNCSCGFLHPNYVLKLAFWKFQGVISGETS